ncbi:ATP-binding protein [Gorillibacterium massiliense]|uniref:ATP-binding protein n=1 Tax=Gorillibacterium massiliense TaxID=1280390 RepID=UPI0005937C9D|nr:ATP-binding protein [Gorillibacterium massiliense]
MQLSIAPEADMTYIGDALKLKQILTNLIGNAVKFTDSGSVCLEVRVHEVEAERMNLHFLIKDTGIGIPKDAINQLFEPFNQLDNFMTRKTKGTGLGLAISKKTGGTDVRTNRAIGYR